jgi:hypothetical protein
VALSRLRVKSSPSPTLARTAEVPQILDEIAAKGPRALRGGVAEYGMVSGGDRASSAKEWLVTDAVLDGTGEPIPGRHPLDGTDLEITYTLWAMIWCCA